MAIREIVGMKDEVFLRKHSRPIEVFDDKLKELIADMYETLADSNGAGLAAPQIGLLRRVAVVDYEGKKLELINAEIIESEGEQTDYEGCLSVKGKDLPVTRPKKIVLLNYDMSGKRHKITASKFYARVICHEMDHWDGILYIDKSTTPDKVDVVKKK